MAHRSLLSAAGSCLSLVVILPVVLLTGLLARGQQSPPPPAPPAAAASPAPVAPAFKVTTRLVQIGVTVHDKNGAVVGLTRDDFEILDRGKPRTISFFSPAGSLAAPPPAALPPNTFSDLPRYESAPPSSITIVLLDNLNTLYGSTPGAYEEGRTWLEDHALSNARAHLLEYLQKLDPRQRVAIYSLTDSLRVLCDFTSDRDRLLAIVRNYDTRARTSREVVDPRATTLPQQPDGGVGPPVDRDRRELAAIANSSRAEYTMVAIKAIADHVANLPGRKSLVWLTANLPFSADALAAILAPAQIAAYPIDGRGLLARSDYRDNSEDMGAAAWGLPGQMGVGRAPSGSDQPTGIDTMTRLAGLTGGKAFVNFNDLTGAIREAVDDSSGLYQIGFYIDAASANGKFHELKVEVKPRGVDVRYPAGYLALRDSAPSESESRTSLVTALRSPVESSAIPLQATIKRVVVPEPNSLLVEGTIDVHGLRFTENNKEHQGAVDVVILEQDVAGKTLAQSSNRLNLRMSSQQYASALATGVRFEKHVAPAPSAVTLRILVQDRASAMVGSLIIPLSQIH